MLSRMLNSAVTGLLIAASLGVSQPSARAVWSSGRPQGPQQVIGVSGGVVRARQPGEAGFHYKQRSFFHADE